MARFYPIYIRRSDGQVAVVTRGSKHKEANQPTDKQMDQKPDENGVSDFYRQVLPDEVKHLDWRRKLGGMLARELDWKDKSGLESGYILVTFPENYRLFEHVKKSEKDVKAEAKSKTHAAGGNDRQDAYLYGHPLGRRKRFRSPADFFPHLLWLCTDESGDPDNCSCKLCCPEDLETVLPETKAVKQVRTDSHAARVSAPQKTSTDGLATMQTKQDAPPPLAAAPAQTPTLPPQIATSQPLKRSSSNTSQQKSQLGASLVSSPLPQATSIDQQLDAEYRGFRYRAGELCWFRKGNAWGLGVILRRWKMQSNHHYMIQPLTNPYQTQPPVEKSSDQEMRPWLAWSVPRFTFTGLNDISPPPLFETVNWRDIAENRYGSGGDMDVDASILAAKSIDSSWTPIDPNLNVPASRGQKFYNAAYIGGEKIWVGETVRLSGSLGEIKIVVVHKIIEQATVDQPTLFLQGDIYVLTTVASANVSESSLASLVKNPHLPSRLIEDLAYRNARSIMVQQVAQYWKLTSTQHNVPINSIKGRWYEASIWLPILQPENFQKMYTTGNVEELSQHLNARGDCLQANRDGTYPKAARVNNRRATRVEALHQAVPQGTQIRDGVNPPSMDSAMDVDQASNKTVRNVDQFMDFSGLNQNQPGYDHTQERPGYY